MLVTRGLQSMSEQRPLILQRENYRIWKIVNGFQIKNVDERKSFQQNRRVY